MIISIRKISSISLFTLLLVAYTPHVSGMERDRCVITKADFEAYINQVRCGGISLEFYPVQAVYEMLSVTDVDALIDATARTAHYVPITVGLDGNKKLFLDTVSECLSLLVERIKANAAKDIQSSHYFDYEIRNKFSRAFYRYASPSEKAEILLATSK